MSDDLNPWAGVQSPQEKEREKTANIERRSPIEERVLQSIEVLSGARGDKREHAVRFKDLEIFQRNIATQIGPEISTASKRVAEKIKAQFSAIDVESRAILEVLQKGFSDASTQVSDINNEINRLDQADADLTTSFTSQIGALSANLTQNYYTITQADAAIAAITTSLNSSIAAVSADLSQNYYTRVNVDDALAAITTSLNSSIDTVSADLSQNYYTIAQTDTAISTAVSTLSSTVNGNTSSITSLTSSVDGVLNTYGLEVNNNGHITGFGFVSQLIAGQNVSDFIINDASLRVVNSSGQGNYTPFAVYPTGRVVDGAFVPAGVHAQDLYVTRANIANLAVDSAKIGNAAITTAKIGDLAVDTLKIAGNAVTVPSFAFGSTLTGNGFFQLAASAFVSLSSPGDIYIFWNISQGYTAGPKPWGYYISGAAGVIETRTGMTFGNDNPSGAIQIANVSGSQPVYFYWVGQDSTITARVSLQVLSRKK